MSFTIRDATLDDIAAITSIYGQSVLDETASFELDPPGEEEMRARFEKVTGAGYPYIAAIDGSGALVGYAYAGAYHLRPAYRWTVENSVYIDPVGRGRGVGRLLIDELIARTTALGFRQMIAIIGGVDHKASIRLHESLGFRHIGVIHGTGFKHGKWLDTVLMQRALGDGKTSAPDENVYPGTLYTRKS